MADWTQEQIDYVWNSSSHQEFKSEAGYRFKKDMSGAWICYEDYGRTTSEYGWELDHINPQSNGGSDNYSNLQALHWANNRHKGDDYPAFETIMTSTNGLFVNTEESKNWQVTNGMIFPSTAVKQYW